MKRKRNLAIPILMLITLGNSVFAGTLPLNTGYDYPNWTTFPTASTATERYWIKLATYPATAGTPGNSWVIAPPPVGWSSALNLVIGTNTYSSTWISAFGNPPIATGTNAINTGYAIYRKCFCLPQGYSQPRITGSVRSDDSIQMYLRSQLNTVLPPSQGNHNTTPYTINYTNPAGFRVGTNCLYAYVEDTGGSTGFNFAGEVTANNVTPLIAQGVNMSYAPCACNQGPIGISEQKKFDLDEKNVVQEIVKMAEAKRIENIRIKNPKN